MRLCSIIITVITQYCRTNVQETLYLCLDLFRSVSIFESIVCVVIIESRGTDVGNHDGATVST